MSECKTCGRDDGHYMGCAEAVKPYAWNGPDGASDPLAEPLKALGFTCAYGDCKNPKRPKGKGPAPKYCDEHSDPKNRK